MKKLAGLLPKRTTPTGVDDGMEQMRELGQIGHDVLEQQASNSKHKVMGLGGGGADVCRNGTIGIHVLQHTHIT